jgi:beta-barrel assembly-enhancing protease
MKTKRGPFGFFRAAVVSALLPASLALGACAISQQQEMQLGAQSASDFNRQLPIVSDASVHQAINVLGDQIGRYGHRGINYTFYVVNSDVVNAFSVPGYVYVNRGLIERTSNWTELAGVLAHEIGHVEERHSAEQIERVQGANMGLNLAYILLGRAPGAVERTAVGLGGSAVLARYSREAENEADRTAIQLMLASRVNPNGLVTMFQKLVADQQRQSSRVEQWFSTHPTSQDRANSISAQIRQIPQAQLRGLSSTSGSYNSLKSRLRSLPAAPRQVVSR